MEDARAIAASASMTGWGPGRWLFVKIKKIWVMRILEARELRIFDELSFQEVKLSSKWHAGPLWRSHCSNSSASSTASVNSATMRQQYAVTVVSSLFPGVIVLGGLPAHYACGRISMQLHMNPDLEKPLSPLVCKIHCRLSMNACFIDEEMETERSQVT